MKILKNPLSVSLPIAPSSATGQPLKFGRGFIFMQEEWKDVAGYEGYYQVSNLSGVRSVERIIKHPMHGTCVKKAKLMTPSINNRGYGYVVFCKEGVTEKFLIHRLMAIAFIPNPEALPCVNHKNGVKLDLSLNNLEWSTYGDNNSHAYQTGLKKAARQSVSEENVRLIRKLHDGGMRNKDICQIVNIPSPKVSGIANRKTYFHVLD